MKFIQDPAVMLRMLEDGDFMPSLQAEMKKVLETLKEVAGPKGKAKGSITLKLAFEIEGVSCSITPEMATKLPKRPASAALFFVTEAGVLSTEHPKQLNMFPKEVGASTAAGE